MSSIIVMPLSPDITEPTGDRMTDISHGRTGARIGFWAWMRLALAVRKERKQLTRLDEHELRDLGLDKPTALAEAKRGLWDVPHHWRV